MSALEKHYILIQQFAVSTLDQFVGSFQSSAHWAFYYTKKVKKFQKRPFPSLQNQDGSNINKICKILTHGGMVYSCVPNRYIEKLGFL